MSLAGQYCSLIGDCIRIFATPGGHRLIDNSFSQLQMFSTMLEIEFVYSENCYSHDLSGDTNITNKAIIRLNLNIDD
jgi:hypothetical protein